MGTDAEALAKGRSLTRSVGSEIRVHLCNPWLIPCPFPVFRFSLKTGMTFNHKEPSAAKPQPKELNRQDAKTPRNLIPNFHLGALASWRFKILSEKRDSSGV